LTTVNELTAKPFIVTPATAEELKLVPVIVRDEPLQSEEGENEVIAGAALTVKQ
jgi:hypothetical protein